MTANNMLLEIHLMFLTIPIPIYFILNYVYIGKINQVNVLIQEPKFWGIYNLP